jgi:hypothetical protein
MNGRDGGFLLNDQQVHEHPSPAERSQLETILRGDGPFLPPCLDGRPPGDKTLGHVHDVKAG